MLEIWLYRIININSQCIAVDGVETKGSTLLENRFKFTVKLTGNYRVHMRLNVK